MNELFDQNLSTVISALQHRIEKVLAEQLVSEDKLPQQLHRAMRYATLNGGKRLRAILVYITGHSLNCDPTILDVPASAIEIIHSYSLIHDDLPAMDDDALRRGQPSCHIAFDEATAILAGDALQTLGFEILSSALPGVITDKQRVAMINSLCKAINSTGMAGGQALDLTSDKKITNVAQLEQIHLLKTGALLIACVQLACISASNIDSNIEQALEQFARCIGLAYQIQDDILDIECPTEKLGKQQGADIALNKANYAIITSIKDAKQRVKELHQTAIDALAPLNNKAVQLMALADYLTHRDY